jgi:hypothetical protein
MGVLPTSSVGSVSMASRADCARSGMARTGLSDARAGRSEARAAGAGRSAPACRRPPPCRHLMAPRRKQDVYFGCCAVAPPALAPGRHSDRSKRGLAGACCGASMRW